MSLTKRLLDAQTESLAGLLAAVLAHPDTPASLYNAMVDELSDLSAEVNPDTPEMIALALEAHAGEAALNMRETS